jgi:hypothetical protein
MAPVGRTRGARKVSGPSFPLDQVVRLWFDRGLAETLESLKGQLSAERLQLPKGWRRLG